MLIRFYNFLTPLYFWLPVADNRLFSLSNNLISFNEVKFLKYFSSSFRLLVFRLLSPLQPCHLTALAEELESAARLHSVTIVLRCRRDDPHSVLLAALPSRDLSWELSRLRAQGWDGLIETSSEVLLCEGDQLLLHFSGNITSAGVTSGRVICLLTFSSHIKSYFLKHIFRFGHIDLLGHLNKYSNVE